MTLNSPVSDSKIERLISTVALGPDSSAVDIGCGEGEFLLRLNRASHASCLGIDLDASLIGAANNKLVDTPGANVRFQQSGIAEAALDESSFDLAICMGSSHAFAEGDSAYPKALEFMRALLKPNGMILIGEGYWQREPDPEYLEFLGEPVGVYNTFEENIAVAEKIGLRPVYATESNLDEWDHFEWSFLLGAERAALSDPDNSDALQKLQRVRQWNACYRKHGRCTMGYGHYIFMKD